MATISTSTALYNKYRPQRFGDVVGQAVPVKTLSNAIESGKVSNAYLLSGLHGTGKTSLARIFAKALLCDDDDRDDIDACGKCSSCRAFEIGSLPDYIEEDAASNRGIDNIRTLISQLSLSPQVSRRKVVLIDEVHHLTSDAATSLLKKLEEPPAGVIFLLVTTDPMKLPSTIRSRCQWLRFKPIATQDIAIRLARIARAEGVVTEPGVCEMIAQSGEGSMRDAVSNLSQVISFAGNRPVTTEDVSMCLGVTSVEKVRALAQSLAEGDLAGALTMEFPDDQGGAKGAMQGVLDMMHRAILPPIPKERRDMTVETLRMKGLPWIMHARSVIERGFWKFDNASFPNEHIVGEMATMIIHPESDPHCSNALANLPQPEVTVVQGGTDNEKVDRILKGVMTVYRELHGMTETVDGLSERFAAAGIVDGADATGTTALPEGTDFVAMQATLDEIHQYVDAMSKRSEAQGKAMKTIIELLRKSTPAGRAGNRRKATAKATDGVAQGEGTPKAGSDSDTTDGGVDTNPYRQPAF